MKEQKLDFLYDKINKYITSYLNNYQNILEKYKSNYILNNPKILYDNKKQNLMLLKDNLNKNIINMIQNNENNINTLKLKLDLLNPENILDKGYSIIYKDNKIIKDVNNLNINDEINIMVKNGKINANVKGVMKNE